MALGVWLWFQRPSPVAPVTQPPTARPADAPAATTVAVTDVPGDGFGIIPGRATPWAIAGGPGEPTPTAEPAATNPPVGAITPLGPPSGSFFRPDDVVSFFWTTSEPPGGGQRFVVYLLNGDERLVMGQVEAANFGRGYQIQAVPGQIAGTTGEYGWVVVLQDDATAAIIGLSETRSLTIIGDN